MDNMQKVVNLKSLCEVSGVAYYKAVNDFKREPKYRNITAQEKETMREKLLEATESFSKTFLS